MKKVLLLCAVAGLAACQHVSSELMSPEVKPTGQLTVCVSRECDMTRSSVGYTEVLDVEKIEKKVSVLVFDKNSGLLNASKTIENTTKECSVAVPVGEKVIWAVVNGPSLDNVMNISQLNDVVDNLNSSSLNNSGLTMIGSVDCTVESGTTVSPTVVVSRLVSRVVLRNVTCKLPAQYGKITVKSIFLGDAFTKQTFAGVVSGKVNPAGYIDADKTIPIGKRSVMAACAEYMHALTEKEVRVGGTLGINECLYCQPNDTEEFTGLYILVTIAGNEYYYRIPLDQGLEANTTYTLDVVITNLGEVDPPTHANEKGGINASVTVASWLPGDVYSAEI